MYVKIILLVLLHTATRIFSEDPCKLNCDSEKNTLCKYCPPGPIKKCGKVIEEVLSGSEIQEILDYHNKLRKDVVKGNVQNQPKGSLMYKLVWSDEVAKGAKRWTEQCESGHDKCRRTVEFKQVGQNWAMMASSQKANYKDLVKMWFDEVKNMTNNEFKPETLSSTGHYTQLAWATTTHLGCAGLVTQEKRMVKTVLVCNYAPAGNMMGTKYVYPAGELCADCKQKGESCSDGLCVCGSSAKCYVTETSIDDSCGGVYSMRWYLMAIFGIGIVLIIGGAILLFWALHTTL